MRRKLKKMSEVELILIENDSTYAINVEHAAVQTLIARMDDLPTP